MLSSINIMASSLFEFEKKPKNVMIKKNKALIPMHEKALSIVKTLKQAGFEAYYAGGWVRDFILHLESDDIDIATNAVPEEIQKLFSHTVPIGIAFGIILVLIDGVSFEVATFRQDIDYKDGRRPTKIAYTSAKEDAQRRDYTINGMFYDPLANKIIDYVNGARDIQDKIIRAIGDPHQRINEDRLRMLRAVRLGSRFGFTIEEHTKKAIIAHSQELFPFVAIERVWQEICKMALHPTFQASMVMMHRLGLLGTIFPSLKDLSTKEVFDRLIHADAFPTKTPAIAKILELFPHTSLQEKETLCQYLKVSNKELLFAYFLHDAHYLFYGKPPQSEVSWAYFYADPRSEMVLEIFSCKIPIGEKPAFMQKQREHREKLSFAIERLQNKDPLVKAVDLKLCGINEGTTMGTLLREAERLSIQRGILDKEEVLGILKKSPLWKP